MTLRKLSLQRRAGARSTSAHDRFDCDLVPIHNEALRCARNNQAVIRTRLSACGQRVVGSRDGGITGGPNYRGGQVHLLP
jgi:hypothetical protein